ncbi:trigger factor [Candidatus Peregrinibacteria bacterium]|nr:trigger factor [Candidatus Peregrinibacteria bacterium]
MNITKSAVNKAEITMTVELTEMEMEKYYQMALEKLSKQVNVKGFRPGKVPKDVAESQLEPGYVRAHAIDMAVPPTSVDAIKQEGIEPVARPQIKVLADNPLKYEAIIPVYPEVKIKDYKKVTITKSQANVTEEEMDSEIKKFQTYHAVYQDVDRAAELGDRVEIDFDGFDETGVPLEGTNSKNHPLILGDNSLVPGFEEQLVGMKKSEEKEISVTFPKDYFHKPFQGKVVKFKVKVNRIEKRDLPGLDAEFIKKVTGKEMSEADFRKELKENLQKSKEMDVQNKLEGEFLDQILAKTEVELSHTLIDEEIAYMMEEQKDHLASKGINWDDYLSATKKTEKDFHDDNHQEAEKRLKVRFAIQELYKLEKIEVSDAEVEAAFQDEMKILASMNYEPKIEEQEMLKKRLTNKLKFEKLLGLFQK